MNLRQIAQEAGVSLTAVSLVLNGKRGVGPAKREKIARLLQTNGYAIQGSPTPDDSKTIAFVRCIRHGHLINGNPGFTTQIMEAAESQCREHNYRLQVITVNRPGPNDPGLDDILNAENIQGALLLATELAPDETASLPHLKAPFVVIDNLLPGENYHCITMNNRESVLAAMNHLFDLGHSRIGLLESSVTCFNTRHRRRAYGHALCMHNNEFDRSIVYPIFPTPDGAYQSVKELLEQGVRFPSALLASNDCIAIGAMQAFREAGIRIPQDISIIGFDGLPFSEISDPPLSTVIVPCEEIGRIAVNMVHQQIEFPNTASFKVMVNTTLALRKSTAPPSPERHKHPNLL